MNRWLACAVLMLAACDLPGPDDPDGDPGFNGLGVRFSLDAPTPTADGVLVGDLLLYELEIPVDQVLFEGEGPEGPVATSDGTDVYVEVVSGSGNEELPTLTLRQGTYDDARMSVRVAAGSGGEPELLYLSGTWDGYDLTVELLGPRTWVASDSSFELLDGPDPVVVFALSPDRWFEGLDFSGAEIDEGSVTVGPDDNVALYQQLLDNLDDGVDGRFPGGFGEGSD